MTKGKQSTEIEAILNKAFLQFHSSDFIADDPISIPHEFSKKQDIEIAAFFAAIIAWGQRKTIIRNGKRIMEIMDNAPHDFIVNHQESDRKKAIGFVHRTFSADDLIYFLHALQQIYRNSAGLETLLKADNTEGVKSSLSQFKQHFFQFEHLNRTEKHIADPLKGSAAKRLNMFLRWMVRPADGGVDFGLWKNISTAQLMMPLDVHTATVGRKLGLLKRKQNDWKAVEELTAALRKYDKNDPVKYDYALFGMGLKKQEFGF